ncbi:MAG: aminotransferase class V-fold PLP-dependent enzyme [Candidatus Aminicenantia bacterium]
MAGFISALDYLAEIGGKYEGAREESMRREKIKKAFEVIRVYESSLSKLVLEGLSMAKDIKVKKELIKEFLFFNEKRVAQEEIAKILPLENIFCWNGHFFALEVLRKFELEYKGGFLRIELLHYNKKEKVEKFIKLLEKI